MPPLPSLFPPAAQANHRQAPSDVAGKAFVDHASRRFLHRVLFAENGAPADCFFHCSDPSHHATMLLTPSLFGRGRTAIMTL